jgi:uncharacterized membrane protein
MVTKMQAVIAFAILLAALGWGGATSAAPAAERIRLCNDTSVPQSSSVAFRRDGQWISEGWTMLLPGACAPIIEGPLTNRFYYFRSESPGWTFRDERINFCVGPEDFTIFGDHDCAVRGYLPGAFAKIDTRPGRGLAVTEEGNLDVYLSAYSLPGDRQGTGELPQLKLEATFTGCDIRRGDGVLQCKFTSAKGQICVDDDGFTSLSILAALQNLPEGTRVQLRGTEVNRFDTVTQARLDQVVPRRDRGTELMLADLEGTWVSEADSFDRFRVKGAERTSFYGDIPTSVEMLSIQSSCGDHSGEGPYLLAQSSDGGGPTLCYRILSLDESSLILAYLPLGKELRFNRQPSQ